MDQLPCGAIRLDQVLRQRRWWRCSEPFTHYRALDVFAPAFHRALERAFSELLARGLCPSLSSERFSRNMPNSDAYGWNFPPRIGGPLALFYSRAWHDAIAALTGVRASGDVNGALHHHPPGTANGSVHRDLGVGWFSSQPRRDGINPMALDRCSYTLGSTAHAGIAARRMVRAVTVIYYLGNAGWRDGDGGETGLYRSADDDVGRPAVRIPPRDNSLLVFENTPDSFHSFIANPRCPRNSIILWLHREHTDVVQRWPATPIATWA